MLLCGCQTAGPCFHGHKWRLPKLKLMEYLAHNNPTSFPVVASDKNMIHTLEDPKTLRLPSLIVGPIFRPLMLAYGCFMGSCFRKSAIVEITLCLYMTDETGLYGYIRHTYICYILSYMNMVLPIYGYNIADIWLYKCTDYFPICVKYIYIYIV